MNSQVIWDINQGWNIPPLPHPETGAVVLAIHTEATHMNESEVLSILNILGYERDLRYTGYFCDDPELPSGHPKTYLYLGTYPINEISERVNALIKNGIPRSGLYLVGEPVFA
jgi:hypothetical protein